MRPVARAPALRRESVVLGLVLALAPVQGCAWSVATGGVAPAADFSVPARAAVQQLVREHGRGAPGYDAQRPPVATLDWDNTMVRQDVGDLALFHALATDGLLTPVSWAAADPALSPAAVALLEGSCRDAGAPDRPLATAAHPDCADAILAIALEGALPDGTPAFAAPDTSSVRRTYLFSARLWRGQTPRQVRDAAEAAWRWGLRQPVGATVRLGRRSVPSWIRLQPPMVQLVRTLQSHGVDVLIVSGSEQHLVEAAAAHAGIPRDRVLGAQLEADARGRLLPGLVPCGADGADRMPYSEGKRCVINRTVFRLPPELQAGVAPPPFRAVLAAGDSDGDLPMLRDATVVRLALDRGRPELMCRALRNEDGRWFVEPLFVEPLPPRAEPYSCGAYRDGTGLPIPDQALPVAHRYPPQP